MFVELRSAIEVRILLCRRAGEATMEIKQGIAFVVLLATACGVWACDEAYRAPCAIVDEQEVIPAPFGPPATLGVGLVRLAAKGPLLQVTSLRLEVSDPAGGLFLPPSVVRLPEALALEVASLDAAGELRERATLPLSGSPVDLAALDWTGDGAVYLAKMDRQLEGTESVASVLRVNKLGSAGALQWSVELESSRCVDCFLLGALRVQAGQLTILHQASPRPSAGSPPPGPRLGYAILDPEGGILSEGEPPCSGGFEGANVDAWARSANGEFAFLWQGAESVVCGPALEPRSSALRVPPGAAGWWDERASEATFAWTDGAGLFMTRLADDGHEVIAPRRLSSSHVAFATAATSELEVAVFRDATGIYFAAARKDGTKLGGDVRL
jgi:hypothetical protein